MKSFSWLKYPLLVIITSCYFFPFEFSFLPGLNTKMLMAAAGLALFVTKIRTTSLRKGFFVPIAFAFLVSLVGLIAVFYNGTNDYTYASYFVSFAVWMGGAYFVVSAIQKAHGGITVDLMIKYLVAVCVAQCLIAITMDRYIVVKKFVDGFLATEGYMGKAGNRLYGIGAALDVAGERFGVILIALAVLMGRQSDDISGWGRILLWICFLIIAIVGNMIGRTTTVGLVIALTYLIVHSRLLTKTWPRGTVQYLKSLLIIVVIGLPLLIYGYNNDNKIRSNIRFGFEGFFSLVESGKWETNSNNRLKGMVTFPDESKTWIIGDGYFNNPNSDPGYIGYNPTEYYQGTDIGYLRFIFYFGVIGLMAFVSFFWSVCKFCREKFPQYDILFLLVLLVNYIVWLKVSTDIFIFFALFLCMKESKISITAADE